MKSALKIVVISALATVAALKGVPALAEPAPAPVNTSFVRTADLDLGSARGQRQLDHRLAQAAREVCGTASDSDLAGKNDVRRCRDETLARAVVQKSSLAAAADRGAVIAVAAAR